MSQPTRIFIHHDEDGKITILSNNPDVRVHYVDTRGEPDEGEWMGDMEIRDITRSEYPHVPAVDTNNSQFIIHDEYEEGEDEDNQAIF